MTLRYPPSPPLSCITVEVVTLLGSPTPHLRDDSQPRAGLYPGEPVGCYSLRLSKPGASPVALDLT